jgi:hypothetical protein
MRICNSSEIKIVRIGNLKTASVLIRGIETESSR